METVIDPRWQVHPRHGQLMDPAHVQSLRQAYHDAQPYKHMVYDNIFDRDFLATVQAEMIVNMQANFKETDLFKLFQTAELAAMSEASLAEHMPHLLKLRNVLYSADFRRVVQEIMQCAELTDRIDCSCNAYANSCHLLCHDDVIGTRCISYILYLSDPDQPWQPQDGGAVELYPLVPDSIVEHGDAGPQGAPEPIPTQSIMPLFNRMLFFAVQPGRSYHSVQEVFTKTRPRLSISGWYHAATPPVGSDRSSLQLILSQGEDTTPFQPIPPAVCTKEFSANDPLAALSPAMLRELQQWISPLYLQRKHLKSICQKFCNDSSVLLHDFLLSDIAERLLKEMVHCDQLMDCVGKGRPALDYRLGVRDGWELVGPPHKQRFLRFHSSSTSSSSQEASSPHARAGQQMQAMAQFLRSEAFAQWLRAATTLIVQGVRQQIRRFRSGFDYTVAHYGILTRVKRLDATLCFVSEERELEQQMLVQLDPSGKDRSGKGKKIKKSGLSKKTAKKAKRSKARVDVASEGEDNSGDQNEEADDAAEEEEDEEEEDFAVQWEDGDVGGFECFIEADTDPETAEAAEVYRSSNSKKGADGEEDEDTLLSVSASFNALSLVLRDEGIMKFIKYVSANAPGSRWDIAGEFEIEDAGSDDDEDDEEDEEEENEDDE